MRFIVKQVHVARRGASDLTRYVSRSKLDPLREGPAARPLFTADADRLTASQARAWLSITGGAWANHDALHYVLSFGQAREYELLGDDETERRQALRTALRPALAAVFDQMGLTTMRWAAGVHRNTAHPHLHLLLNKNAVQRASGDLVTVSRLARTVLPHNLRPPDGAKVFAPGLLLTVYAARLDDWQRDRTRWLRFAGPGHETAFTRALVAPETLRTRPPTPAEQLAGRWLQAELGLTATMANPNILPALRAAVAQLDQTALAHRQPVPAVYLDAADLRAVLLAAPTRWHVAPHRQEPVNASAAPRLWSPLNLPETNWLLASRQTQTHHLLPETRSFTPPRQAR